MLGSLVADAVSMPVHWYYNVSALDKDYGLLKGYCEPKNPHPDSILWRSSYTPRNKDADILHNHAEFWGQRGVHYHQCLLAGENTLNFRLGVELYKSTVQAGTYNSDGWLETYIRRMRTPGWNRDTYVEEYHRAFFDNLATGKHPKQCGIVDIHIGGLAQIPFLIAALETIGICEESSVVETVLEHVSLTHRGEAVARSAETFTRVILAIANGSKLREAIQLHAVKFKSTQLEAWSEFEDRQVVGRHLTTACYLPDSFTAALYLSWKYAEDFSAGVLANARCGGDNCHRGTVVGALLAAANGIPEHWRRGLKVAKSLSAVADEQRI